MGVMMMFESWVVSERSTGYSNSVEVFGEIGSCKQNVNRRKETMCQHDLRSCLLERIVKERRGLSEQERPNVDRKTRTMGLRLCSSSVEVYGHLSFVISAREMALRLYVGPEGGPVWGSGSKVEDRLTRGD